MEERQAYVVGLRLDLAASNAPWYTLWFEEADGTNHLASHDGRLIWTPTADAARDLAPTGVRVPVVSSDPALCDVALVLRAVAAGEVGNEAEVLDSLNLLDDAVITVGQRDVPGVATLDRLVKELTEGRPLPEAVQTVGGSDSVVQPIFNTLGRVFASSVFRL